MGMFSRLFRKDPAQLVEKGEERLAAGDALRALHSAQDALSAVDRSTNPTVKEAAESLETRARAAFMTGALDKALRARDAGIPDEAVEWLETAQDHCRDADQSQEIAELLAAMRQLVEEQESENPPPPPPRRTSSPAGNALGGGGGSLEGGSIMGGGIAEVVLDDEESAEGASRRSEGSSDEDDFTLYDTLVETMADGIADQYRGRSEEFQRALVALNEGEGAAALEDLERLLEATPEDPVLIFERGRCRLSMEQFEAAAEDFEAVWDTLGTDPLDRAGDLSIPLLWAYSRLGLGQSEPIVDRLRELATPDQQRFGLMECFATALLESGKVEEALQYLGVVTESFPRPTFRFLMGRGLVQLGHRERASHVFEEIIAPACKVGCTRQPLHRPSARALLGIYLGQEETLERAEEIATLLLMEQGAGLEAEDRAVLAAYFDRVEDPDSAAEMRADVAAPAS